MSTRMEGIPGGSEAVLAAELDDARRLQQISTRLIGAEGVDGLHEAMLDAAIGLMDADAGSVQVLERDTGQLRLLAWRGFHRDAVDYWSRVGEEPGAACSVALSGGRRVIVPDLEHWPPAAGTTSLEMYRRSGIRAVQSTPLVARTGEPIGMLTTHWRYSHVPPERRLRLLDVLARQAADLIERAQVEAALRESESRHTFLLLYSDALRPIQDAVELQRTSCALLGHRLGADRVHYAEFRRAEGIVQIAADWCRDESRSLAGRYDFAWFTEARAALRSGRPFVVEDTATSPQISECARPNYLAAGIRAFIAAPLVRGGDLVWTLDVISDTPRAWRAGEVGLVQEAGERTWADIERIRSTQALREMDRRKDEFLATLAHELRNPLAPIRTAAHVLRAPNAAEHHRQEARAMIERQVGTMTRLVDDLLEVSRLTLGRIELQREPVSLSVAVTQAIEAAMPAIAEGQHAIDVELPEVAPWVDADLTRLAQVFTNLLTNAAKYTPPGGRITVAVGREDGEAVVSVRDTGIGIPADMLDRVFEMFAQVRRGHRMAQGGLGIGLALARRLVEMHGGTLVVRSEGEGRGSEFTVRLPASEPPRARLPEAPDAVAATAGRRVLIVDDNVDAAESLAMLLGTLGHEVRCEYSGEAALAAVERHPWDAVLLDIGLPRMDGCEVARSIRERKAAAAEPVPLLVAVSGRGMPADRERALQSGFHHHLTKPADPERIMELIARELDSRA